MGEGVLSALVLGVVAVATTTDLRSRRIPNRLTLPAALAGLVLNATFSGGDGVLASASGWALGCALLLPLFLLRGLGAGDVKLVAALGALKGPEFVFFTCLWAAVFGGPMALVGLLRARRLGLALAHLYLFKMFPHPDGSLITAGRIPYAPAIALGALLALGGVRWIGG